jgi:hypothetical protein
MQSFEKVRTYGGAITCGLVEVACIRWGGGAKPGKTHVFAMGDLGFFEGHQCVVDDFGDLVAVA